MLNARHLSSDTAAGSFHGFDGFDGGAEPEGRCEPEDRREGAQVRERRRRADGINGAPVLRPQPRTGVSHSGATRCCRSTTACADLGIDHRLKKPDDPRTNGQVERMNRALEVATARRNHDDRRNALRAHLRTFLEAKNSAKHARILKGRTPFEFILEK